MLIQRLGHAALLLEIGGTRVLIDPGGYSVDEAFGLTDIDLLVVTHAHPDHADPSRLPGLLTRIPDAVVLAEAAAAAALPALAERATTLASGATHTVGGVTITGVGGQHAVIHPELPRATNVGVVVRAEGAPTLFHPGDSYEAVPEGVDVLALPMSAPWAKLAETIGFSRRIGAGTVIPIHDAALTPHGYPIYWRTLEQLGGAGRYERLGATGDLSIG